MKRSSVREVEGDWSDEEEPAKSVQPAKAGFGIGRRRGLSNPAQVGRKGAESKKVRRGMERTNERKKGRKEEKNPSLTVCAERA